MAGRAEQVSSEVVAGVLQLVRERVGPERLEITVSFVSQFYAHVPPGDIAVAGLERLYGAALAVWQFGAVRPARAPLVRVFTAQIDRDNWQSRHSVVEVVTDDMPFLVGSLTEALRQEGLAVHIVIHPVLRVLRDQGGRLVALYPPGSAPAGASLESFIHLSIDRLDGPSRMEAGSGGPGDGGSALPGPARWRRRLHRGR
jgi:glutamate dehydrogenase